MKKLLIIIAVMTGLLASCSDPSDNQGNNTGNKSKIVFDNTRGICTVSVYGDSRRQDQDKIADVQAGGNSAEIEWTSGASVTFYFSYHVNLADVAGFTLNYVPEAGKDRKDARIDAGKKTVITIPKLDETVSSPDVLLSDNSYILLKNSSSFQIQLHRGISGQNSGTTIITPDNSTATVVNSGEQKRYTISPGDASTYKLLMGADYKDFPSSLIFQAGHVYSFVFNGVVSLVSDTEIKLKNVNGLGIGNTGAVTVSISGSGQLTLNWPAVDGADQYDVYYSTNNSMPSSPAQTVSTNTTIISGLINGTTYYMWVKPKNAVNSGGVSAAVSGVPRSYSSPGLYRGVNKIGDQNLAASLTWISANAVSGDDFYILLGANESFPLQKLTYSGKTVSITLIGFGGERTITPNSNGSLFYVFSGVTLTLNESITLMGYNSNSMALVYVENGKLIINSGAKITGNKTSDSASNTTANSGLGGGVYMYDGTFIMNGGEISNNTAVRSSGNGNSYGGGVHVNKGTFTMKGGEISSNTASSSNGGYGGGVCVSSNGTFIMEGGKISGNTASGSTSSCFGGGVDIFGTFTMSGGEISGNTSIYGGGICTHSGGSANINGGETSGNNAIYGGGAYTEGTFTMNGGEISGNTATENGGGVNVSSKGSFNMKGGEISGNTAKFGGGVLIFGTVIMSGGSILGNTVTNAGGGVCISGSFTMNNGKISGNTANYGGGVYSVAEGTFNMGGGEISGNTANTFGGGVGIKSGATFVKTAGTIRGYEQQSGDNAVKNTAGVIQNAKGHAVYVDSSPVKRRETTAGPGVNINSSLSGTAGGWE